MLARRGVSLVGTIKIAALVQVVRRGSFVDEAAAELRAVVRRAMQRHVAPHDPQSAAIALAILIGDRGSLDPVVEQRLQQAGTYHVIAISGGNIAILAGVVLSLLWMAWIRDGWASGAVIAVLAAYAYVAGGGPSVVRATVMAALYLGLRMIDQRTAPLHAMALTVVAILLATPLAIADVGLWLTFGATAAIVAGAKVLPLPGRPWLRAPVTLVLASLSAEIVLMPVAALVFQRVTVAGLAANLGAIPAMGVAQIAAMVTAAADAARIEAVARIAGWITHLSIRALLGSSALVDVAPWLTWRVPPPAMIVVVAYYACLVAALILVKRQRPALIAAALLIWIVAAPQTWHRIYGDGRLHVTMMDVGQGDAVLVTLPNGRTLMVDSGGIASGGDFDIGDRVLGPALRHRGIRRLDYLAITHGDQDHIGGAWSLVRDFSPLEIWYGTYVNHHQASMRLQRIAVDQRVAWRWLLAADRVELGGVEVRVHHPPPADWQRQKVRNDDSVVLELRYGQVSLLLTGDISREVEDSLIPALDLLPIVILKSPHHGSGSSSSEAFIQKLKPRIVLISCGRGNPFGHPQPYVVQRYRDAGAEIFRTDLDGQIEIVTDGLSILATKYTNHAEVHEELFPNTKGGSNAH
jgi:competence protein ComEC